MQKQAPGCRSRGRVLHSISAPFWLQDRGPVTSPERFPKRARQGRGRRAESAGRQPVSRPNRPLRPGSMPTGPDTPPPAVGGAPASRPPAGVSLWSLVRGHCAWLQGPLLDELTAGARWSERGAGLSPPRPARGTEQRPLLALEASLEPWTQHPKPGLLRTPSPTPPASLVSQKSSCLNPHGLVDRIPVFAEIK